MLAKNENNDRSKLSETNQIRTKSYVDLRKGKDPEKTIEKRRYSKKKPQNFGKVVNFEMKVKVFG